MKQDEIDGEELYKIMSQGKIRDHTDLAGWSHCAGESRKRLNRRYLAVSPMTLRPLILPNRAQCCPETPAPETEADPHPRSYCSIRKVPPHDLVAPPPKWGPRAIPRIHGVTLSPVTLSPCHVPHPAVVAPTSTALPQRVARLHRHRCRPRPMLLPPTQVRCIQYAHPCCLQTHPSPLPAFDDGRTQLLLCLHGLLPITYRGAPYNIPMAFWITRDYPRHPPIAYVVPTTNMLVRSGKYVDVSGRCNTEYIQNWERKDEVGYIPSATSFASCLSCH